MMGCGEILTERIFRSVVRSQMKLSYQEAEDIIDGKRVEKISNHNSSNEIVSSIESLAEIALKIRKHQSPNGQQHADFKNDYLINENGDIIDTFRIWEGKSNAVVGAMMITANGIVGKFLKVSNQGKFDKILISFEFL